MVDGAETARMTVDFHVVRRVAKDHGGALLAHQCCEGRGIEGAAAQQPIATKQPEIAELADWRPSRDLGQDVGRILVLEG